MSQGSIVNLISHAETNTYKKVTCVHSLKTEKNTSKLITNSHTKLLSLLCSSLYTYSVYAVI